MTDKMTIYHFNFTSTADTEGIVGTLLSREETLEKLNTEMTENFGEGKFMINDFRELSEEEMIEMDIDIEAMKLQAMASEASKPTLN